MPWKMWTRMQQQRCSLFKPRSTRRRQPPPPHTASRVSAAHRVSVTIRRGTLTAAAAVLLAQSAAAPQQLRRPRSRAHCPVCPVVAWRWLCRRPAPQRCVAAASLPTTSWPSLACRSSLWSIQTMRTPSQRCVRVPYTRAAPRVRPCSRAVHTTRQPVCAVRARRESAVCVERAARSSSSSPLPRRPQL